MYLGIKKYNFVLSTNKVNNIKEKLLENKDIEWLEIERIGTKYVIKVEERKLKEKEDECFPRNIVSKKNAVITKINVENGEIIKKKNDYVVAGETIVSGLIHNKETVKTKVCAKGLIYGKTWYKVRLSLENTTLNTVYTSNEKTGFFIKMLNKEYKLGNKFSKYKIKKCPQTAYQAVLRAFDIGRGRRDRTLGTRFWRPVVFQLFFRIIPPFSKIQFRIWL